MKVDEFKREFVHPKLLLFTCHGILENSLVTRDINTARNIVLIKQQNEVTKLEFEIPFYKDRKISYDDCEKLIKLENEYYIIKNINVEDGGNRTIKVQCEHESTELKGKYCECINEIGASPEQMFISIFNSIMTPIPPNQYKWGGTDVDKTIKRHLTTESESSIYENLISMAKVFNGWIQIKTDDSGQKWIYLWTKYKNKGKKIKKNLNMKELSITYDSTEICTQLYAEGAQDELTGNPVTIMEANPTGKSYVENYSWYLAKGIPSEMVDKEPKYQQLKKISDDTYINPKDLYQLALEELEKCCKPKLTASLTLRDLTAYIDSLDDELEIGDEIICINKDIDFVFTCQVVGVERDFEKPLETKITIQNFIRYDTNFQNINHTIDTLDRVVSTNPFDTDGNPIGDGKPYIPMCNVLDGDHWNAEKRLGQQYSFAKQTYDNINLKVEDTGKSIAQIDIKADQITSTVEEVQDGVTTAKSEIRQTARKITAVVEEGDESGSWELSKDAFKVAFSGITNDITTIDGQGIITNNNDGSYTRMGSKGLEHIEDGMSRPYHYLTYTHVYEGLDAGTDYEVHNFNLPAQFQKFNPEDIAVSASIAKANDSNDGENVLMYWVGVYAYVTGSKGNIGVKLYCLACWRKPEYDSNESSSWVSGFTEPKAGKLNVQITVIA